jgi:hypothetical protein
MSSIHILQTELYNSAVSNDLLVLNRLLQRGLDPSAHNNRAFQLAAEYGHLAVVERLLQDPRVDPSAGNNNTIRWASANGHHLVVERLLQYPRVDPSANDNEALAVASYYGHYLIVALLLQDPRVDPNVLHRSYCTQNINIDQFSEKSLMILSVKLDKDFPIDSKIIHWKPRIDKYLEELFDIADYFDVVLDETLDNDGLQRNIWETVYEYLEHKLPEQ